jgi:lysozyme
MNLRQQIEGFEGREYMAYPDPLTRGDPWTIGVGHTGPEVHRGLVWTDAQIDAALDADIAEKVSHCRSSFPWFDALNEPRQAVLVNMCFQMGIGRLIGFTNTLADIRDERWPNAAEQMRRSVWAHQTPKRAIRLAYQLETGEWQ